MTFLRMSVPSASPGNIEDTASIFFNCKLNFAEMPSKVALGEEWSLTLARPARECRGSITTECVCHSTCILLNAALVTLLDVHRNAEFTLLRGR